MDRAFGIIGLFALFIPPLLYSLGFLAICLSKRNRSIVVDVLGCLATSIPFIAIGGIALLRFFEFIIAHIFLFGVIFPAMLGTGAELLYAGWKSRIAITSKNS